MINFDSEKSHTLQALLKKMYFGEALSQNGWEAFYRDVEKYLLGGILKGTSKSQIVEKLGSYGINSYNGKEKIEIGGSGNPKREFLFSKDMADAYMFIMENISFEEIVSQTNPESGKYCMGIRNTHINIGAGDEISI